MGVSSKFYRKAKVIISFIKELNATRKLQLRSLVRCDSCDMLSDIEF